MSGRLKSVFSDKWFIGSLLLIMLALVMFVGAVYSYGKISESELKVSETKITYIEGKMSRRSGCVCFETEGGVSFYCPDDLLDMGNTEKTAEWLAEKCEDKTVTVKYTERRDLLPLNILRYFDYKRLVSLECGGEELLSLATYNNVNQGYMLAWIAISLVPFIIGSYFVISKLRRD